MPYFRTFVVTANQPNFSQVAQQSENALNNYLKYGKFLLQSPAELAINPGFVPLKKEKEVEHMQITQTVHNGTIYHTITLCCEDDEDYE